MPASRNSSRQMALADLLRSGFDLDSLIGHTMVFDGRCVCFDDDSQEIDESNGIPLENGDLYLPPRKG